MNSIDIIPQYLKKGIWGTKGHLLGTHILSPDGRLALLTIPKNASSYWKTWLIDEFNWRLISEPPATSIEKVIVPLRDPVERWLSGISEYLLLYSDERIVPMDETIMQRVLSGYQKNDWVPFPRALLLNMLQDGVVFDDHTEKQSYFYNCLDTDKVVYFKSENPHLIWKYIEEQGYERPDQGADIPINWTDDPNDPDGERRRFWKTYIVEQQLDLSLVKRYYEYWDSKTYEILNGL